MSGGGAPPGLKGPKGVAEVRIRGGTLEGKVVRVVVEVVVMVRGRVVRRVRGTVRVRVVFGGSRVVGWRRVWVVERVAWGRVRVVRERVVRVVVVVVGGEARGEGALREQAAEMMDGLKVWRVMGVRMVRRPGGVGVGEVALVGRVELRGVALVGAVAGRGWLLGWVLWVLGEEVELVVGVG